MKHDGLTAPGGNLIVYREAKKAAYSDLSRAERLEWEALAKAHNDKINAPPSMDHIFEYAYHPFLHSLLLTSSNFSVDIRAMFPKMLSLLYWDSGEMDGASTETCFSFYKAPIVTKITM